MAIIIQPAGNPNLLVRPAGHRDWSSGLCGCCTDCGSCFCTWCCLPCMLCRLSSRMDECCMMPHCVPFALLAMRTKVRTMGGIQGSICKDCAAIACCGMCAVCQMSRELDYMGL